MTQITSIEGWRVLALVSIVDAGLFRGMHREGPLRIVIADDSAPWRVQLRSLLEARPEWQIIGEACHGLEVVRMTKELLPDIVLLDIGMPVLNGIDAAKQIRQDSPTSKIIFATQNNDSEIRREALATGAEGYVLKANAARELLPVIDAALKNGRVPMHTSRAEQKRDRP